MSQQKYIPGDGSLPSLALRMTVLWGIGLGVWLMVSGCSGNTPRQGSPDPYAAVTATEIGMQYLLEDQWAAAEESFTRALVLNEQYFLAWLGMGSLRERQGNFAAAKEGYSRAFALAPDNPYVLTNYGDFLCRQEQSSVGVIYLEQAVQKADSLLKTAALASAGICALKEGDVRRAEIWLRQALEREPNYAEALLGMAQVSLYQDRPLSVRAFLSRLQGVGQMTPAAVELCIEAEQRLGNPLPEDLCRAVPPVDLSNEQWTAMQKTSRSGRW